MSNSYGFSIEISTSIATSHGFSIELTPSIVIRTINASDEIVTGSTVKIYQSDVLITEINSDNGSYLLGALEAGTYEIGNSASDRRQEFIYDGTTFQLIDFVILGITKNYRVRALLTDIGSYPTNYSNILTVRV